MKIEPGHGVVFLLRNTKGDASYGSAMVRKLTAQGVSIADVRAPQRLTGVTPAWVFAPNVVCFTETPKMALFLTCSFNRIDEEEQALILKNQQRSEQLRQELIERFQLSEKED